MPNKKLASARGQHKSQQRVYLGLGRRDFYCDRLMALRPFMLLQSSEISGQQSSIMQHNGPATTAIIKLGHHPIGRRRPSTQRSDKWKDRQTQPELEPKRNGLSDRRLFPLYQAAKFLVISLFISTFHGNVDLSFLTALKPSADISLPLIHATYQLRFDLAALQLDLRSVCQLPPP